MSRVFGAGALEGLATFWRVKRRDGVALGLTGHDRDLWLDGVLHKAAPGMLPSSIRRSAGLSPDSAGIEGAITHDSLSAADLAAGRFDGARVEMGVADWEGGESAVLYRGEFGALGEEGGRFEVELLSAKAALEIDPVPRTSPTCRAPFCGPGCNLPPARFTHTLQVAAIDFAANRVTFTGGPAPEALRQGHLRWIDGPQAGLRMEVISADADGLRLDTLLNPALAPGLRAELREGCDHTFATCQTRFANSVSFRGEPFLPGNDMLTRYPTSSNR